MSKLYYIFNKQGYLEIKGRCKNTTMQYIEFSEVVKLKKFHQNNFDIFYIFAQNIDCGYMLEPPRPSGSNEYPHSVLERK